MTRKKQPGRFRTAFETFFHQLAVLVRLVKPRGFWLPRSRYWRDVVVSLALGCVVALALRSAPETGWLATKQDQAMDWMLRMHSGVSPAEYRGVPFVFVDLDEATYRAWGEPFHIPRNKLSELLEFSVEGGAALVLVDVDLSRRSGPQDRPLVELLERFVSEPERTRSDGTQILLTRTFREPYPRGASPWLEERRSFLDRLVAAAPNVHWVSTLFIRESDLKIRRFRNFEPTCNGAEANVVPAMQILATALILDPAQGTQKLHAAMQAYLPDCEQANEGGTRTGDEVPDQYLQLGDVEIALMGDRVSRRILYNVGWRLGEGEPRGLTVPFRGREARLLTHLPAHLVTESDRPLDPSLAQDRIVVIGASYADSRDVHLTPLGEMPGAMILTNAIDSLLQHGGLKPPSTGLILTAQFLLIAVVSLAFAALPFSWAAVLGTPLVILVLLPVSFWLFRHGVWLDLAIPLLAVQVQAAGKKYWEYSRFRARLNTLERQSSQKEGADPPCEPDSREGEVESEAEADQAGCAAGSGR